MIYAYIDWSVPRLISLIEYGHAPQGIREVGGMPVLVPAVIDAQPEYVEATHKLVTHEAFTAVQYHRYYEVLALTEAELIERVNSQADDADAEIPAPLLRRVLAPLLPIEPGAADAMLFPAWRVPLAIQIGEIYRYPGDEFLYRVVQAHTTQHDWPPPLVPALFVRVAEPGTIPDWVQPAGGHDAYNMGDQVRHVGKVWESTINANVWEPGVYGWVEVV